MDYHIKSRNWEQIFLVIESPRQKSRGIISNMFSEQENVENP